MRHRDGLTYLRVNLAISGLDHGVECRDQLNLVLHEFGMACMDVYSSGLRPIDAYRLIRMALYRKYTPSSVPDSSDFIMK